MSDPLEFLDEDARRAVEAYAAKHQCTEEEALNAMLRPAVDVVSNVVNEHLAQHRALGLKGDTET